MSSTDFGLYEGWGALVASGVVSFARGSAAWTFGADGTLVAYSAGEHRLLDAGLVIEPASTNLLKGNTALDGDFWFYFDDFDGRQVTIGGITGPDGTASMAQATSNGIGENVGFASSAYAQRNNMPELRFQAHSISAIVSGTSTAPYCVLIAKNRSLEMSGICFDIATGAVTNTFTEGGGTVSGAKVTAHGAFWRPSFELDGWTHDETRIELYGTTSDSVSTMAELEAAALPAGETLVGGWVQAEAGAVTSPIKTGSSSATRAADQLVLAIGDGTYDIEAQFGDGTAAQTLAGIEVSGGAGWTVPALNSPLITDIIVRAAA